MRHGKLTAILAAAVLATACGPGDPPGAPPGDGTPPAGGGGAEPGVTPAAPSGGAAGEGGGGAAPRWVTVIGGLGSEYVHDVAAVGGDAIAALNLVGVSGDRVDELGLHVLEQPDGREASRRFHAVGGVPLRLAPGSLAAADRALYLAFTASCDRRPCARIGGVPVDGALLVKLSTSGDVEWAHALRGEVASNVAASADGAAVVTVERGVAVVHRFRADGAVAWEMSGEQRGTAVALDVAGNVVVAGGGTVAKLGPAGNALWRVAVPEGTEDVAASPPDALVVYGGGVVVGLDADGTRRWSTRVGGAAGAGEVKRLAAAPDGSVSVLAGAGCGAVLARLAPTGEPLGSRPLVRGGCAGDDVRFFGLAATSEGAAVCGAIRANAVDLGVPHRDVSGPLDGFVVQLDG